MVDAENSAQRKYLFGMTLEQLQEVVFLLECHVSRQDRYADGCM